MNKWTIYIITIIDTAHPPVTSIRFIPSSDINSRIIQVRYTNTWGAICSSEWSLQDTHVICRQLGYINGTRTILMPVSNLKGTNKTIWLTGVHCQGTEESIGACRIETIWSKTGCTSSQVVAVECTSNHTPL